MRLLILITCAASAVVDKLSALVAGTRATRLANLSGRMLPQRLVHCRDALDLAYHAINTQVNEELPSLLELMGSLVKQPFDEPLSEQLQLKLIRFDAAVFEGRDRIMPFITRGWHAHAAIASGDWSELTRAAAIRIKVEKLKHVSRLDKLLADFDRLNLEHYAYGFSFVLHELLDACDIQKKQLQLAIGKFYVGGFTHWSVEKKIRSARAVVKLAKPLALTELAAEVSLAAFREHLANDDYERVVQARGAPYSPNLVLFLKAIGMTISYYCINRASSISTRELLLIVDSLTREVRRGDSKELKAASVALSRARELVEARKLVMSQAQEQFESLPSTEPSIEKASLYKSRAAAVRKQTRLYADARIGMFSVAESFINDSLNS